MRSRPRPPRGMLVATGPVVLVVAGIVGYLSFGYPPWTAVAMTLLTLTTVGFASGTHLSTGALVFSAGLALLGVGRGRRGDHEIPAERWGAAQRPAHITICTVGSWSRWPPDATPNRAICVR
jgi:hypothetical protein